MVDWSSPEEIARDAVIFGNLLHAMVGLYVWEFLVSLNFEWDIITGRKRFRWPLAFYFAGRYSLLALLIAIMISIGATETKINCQAVTVFQQLMAGVTIGMASINLAIRTVAIWAQNKILIGALILLIIGHWSLLLQAAVLKSVWIKGSGCALIKTNNAIGGALYSYTMAFDFLILMLSAWKLSRGSGRGALAKLLFRDGLLYFCIVFIVNILSAVFVLLELNVVMTVMFDVPAAVISTIAASRAVRRLSNFFGPGSESSAFVRPTMPDSGIRVRMNTVTRDDATELDEVPTDKSLQC